MTSILTNTSAIVALQTLRSIHSCLADTQQQVSSGLRVANASDNAAYWSIATTMRSDEKAMGAVQDAIGLGAAKVDTAYSAMESTIDVLTEFRAKLVAAKEPGVDRAKIQAELEELKEQTVSIAKSASFNGVNWLNTNINDMYDERQVMTTVVSSFTRSVKNGVTVNTMDVDLSSISLFNSTGGGLLQTDPRNVGSIGGIRPAFNFGSAGSFPLDNFPVDSPLDFNAPGAEISFKLLLDKDRDDGTGLQYLPGPYDGGYTTPVISITKNDVDAYNPSLGGIISTDTQFSGILNQKLVPLGAFIDSNYRMEDPDNPGHWIDDPARMGIRTLEKYGDGSYVEIFNLSSTGVSTGGLKEGSDYGSRGSGMELAFVPFTAFKDAKDENKDGADDGITISFSFSVNGKTPTSYTFDRTYVNDLLGKTDGQIATADEMVTLLHSFLDADWPNLIIELTASGNVLIEFDPDVDRAWGERTRIAFSHFRVSNEPLGRDFLDIDIEQNPDWADRYITDLETMTAKVIDGAATLGSLRSRIDMQTDFAKKLMDNYRSGVSRLVDADMNETSARLKALQTQEQLGIQALQIANSSADNIMQLFR